MTSNRWRLRTVVRRWCNPVRGTTVLSGVALGVLLVTALAIAGVIGMAPLSGPERYGDRSAEPFTARQPELRRGLLASADLPAGYAPAGPPAGPVPDAVGPPATIGGPGGPGGGPGRTGDPGGLGDAVTGVLPEIGISGLGPAGSTPGAPDGPDVPGAPGAPGGARPEATPHGDPPAGPDGSHQRCRTLVERPWEIAAAEGTSAAPETADHADATRGVLLSQALGGFTGDGAARALQRLRKAAAGCPDTAARLPDGTPVTVAFGPPEIATDGADEGYTVPLRAVGGGRAWTGHLAVDRVGRVLSVLRHVGPEGVLTAGELARTRAAAVDKARPAGLGR